MMHIAGQIAHYDLRNIPGFTQIKAWQYARYWYIVDCTDTSGNWWPGRTTIGARVKTLAELYAYCEHNYTGRFD